MEYLYTMEHSSAAEKSIMLSELNQNEKDKYNLFSHVDSRPKTKMN
jgi:hypothetical protein